MVPPKNVALCNLLYFNTKFAHSSCRGGKLAHHHVVYWRLARNVARVCAEGAGGGDAARGDETRQTTDVRTVQLCFPPQNQLTFALLLCLPPLHFLRRVTISSYSTISFRPRAHSCVVTFRCKRPVRDIAREGAGARQDAVIIMLCCMHSHT